MLDNNLNPEDGNVNDKTYTSSDFHHQDSTEKGTGQTKKDRSKKAIDVSEIKRFLNLVDPDQDQFLIVSFDDDKSRREAREKYIAPHRNTQFELIRKRAALKEDPKNKQLAAEVKDLSAKWNQVQKDAPGFAGQAKFDEINTDPKRGMLFWMRKRQTQGCGIFACVQAMQDGKVRKNHLLTYVRAVFVEDDESRADGQPRTDWPLKPSIVVQSSPGKFHYYWLVEWSTSFDRECFEGVMRRMIADHGSDPNAKDVSRVMRLPGTCHLKGDPFQSHIVEAEGYRYSHAEIVEAFPPIPVERHEGGAGQRQHYSASGKMERFTEPGNPLDKIPADGYDEWLQVGMGLHHESGGSSEGLNIWRAWSSGSTKFTEGACEAKWSGFKSGSGVTGGVIYALAKDYGWQREDLEREREKRNGPKRQREPDMDYNGSDQGPEDRDDHRDDQPETGKPSIVVEGGQLDQMAITAQDLLIKAGVEFYIRGDKLVRPVTETVVDSRGKKTKSAVLVEVERSYMRGTLCRHIDWLKYDGRSKDYKAVDAPEEVAKLILARRGEWKFPVIAGVISTPTLRFDGTIISEPGYDERTHLYLESPVKLPAMPEKPTMADAQAALGRIKALYVEFPFTSQAALSVSLSAMLTAVARGMMDVAPAHGWRAPTAGTGKSYSADITSAVVAGTRCPVISAADEAAETEKRIISKAMGGAPIINIDNVNGVLGGDTLCQLISQPICELRILGKTELLKLNNRACVFFNGNNVRVKGDMTRRVLIAELDAQMEKPGEREFKLNPVEMVLKDRGQYIADCLTIIRAYVMAGKPKVVPFPMNSFEDWSNSVRSAMIWLGCADPCETIQAARDEDPELQKLGMFIEAAKTTATREQPLLTSEIINRASDQYDGQYLNEDLNTALRLIADIRGFINARAAGAWLSKMKGRIVDGLRIAMVMDGKKKQPRWFIEAVAA